MSAWCACVQQQFLTFCIALGCILFWQLDFQRLSVSNTTLTYCAYVMSVCDFLVLRDWRAQS